MKEQDLKKNRLDLRISDNDKELIEKAIAINGNSTMTSFILNAARKQAKEIVEEHETILASEKDKQGFFNAILSTENEPNEALKKAIKRHLEP
jgi:uncharacterized protein (DUF1778 family)